jgi:hypothetical protein
VFPRGARLRVHACRFSEEEIKDVANCLFTRRPLIVKVTPERVNGFETAGTRYL